MIHLACTFLIRCPAVMCINIPVLSLPVVSLTVVSLYLWKTAATLLDLQLEEPVSFQMHLKESHPNTDGSLVTSQKWMIWTRTRTRTRDSTMIISKTRTSLFIDKNHDRDQD